MATLSILGGRVIDPASNVDLVTDVHIADEKILALGTAPPDFSAEQQIEAKNQIVCPGLIDLSVRLREPGAEHKGTIISETRAAAASGVTTICCPPDTNPVIDTPAVAKLLQHRATEAGMAKILPLAALTQGLKGEHLAEMGVLKEAGCIGVSNVLPIVNTQVLRHALEYAANCDLTVFLQAHDKWLGHNGCVHEGAVSTRLGLLGVPETAETIEVARDLLLIEMIGIRAHFCRLSTARAVDMVKEAQVDIKNYDSQCHVNPPLRSQQDKKGLREGLLQGSINAITSDHQPHEADAKLSPFAMSASGISAIDSLLPLSLRLAEETQIDLITALAGTLTVGHKADICIFDPNCQWTLTPDNMHSLGHNSPFLGWEFKGKVSYTLINGRVVYNNLDSR